MTTRYTHIVLGLGVTGLSVVRYLYRQGIVPLVMDTRTKPPGMAELTQEFPEVTLHTGRFDCRPLIQAEQIIVSPGIPLATPEILAAKDMGVEIIGDIELFAREVKSRPPCVIAITGSNGKSTVTTLVTQMMQEAGIPVAMGGNIGVPALSLLDLPVSFYVLELSSFQLESTHSLNCIAATCLNVSEDHMDRYSDMQAYCHTKVRLYDQSQQVLFNHDDPNTHPKTRSYQDGSKGIEHNCFGLNAPISPLAWGRHNGNIVQGSEIIMPLEEIALLGKHNQANLLAAMALAHYGGSERDALVKTARAFTGLAHRCENLALKQGVLYVNDSKATNVGATVAALEGFEDFNGNIILIAGGLGKGADFRPLSKALDKVAYLITLGQDGQLIANLKENTHKVQTLKQAVHHSRKLAKPGDMVLLSPACASFDMYPNFMARGDDFRAIVEALDDLD